MVDKTTEIVFDTNCFDKLKIDEERKKDIKLIIQNYRDIDNDVITGKGGGIIFLLHGPPGVGKTLTAEATSETLKKPIYSVNVGELGTDVHQLENKLKDILEICYQWDAVLLLDEADIYLEKRSDTDIVRNSMVGIFLRLLEYYQGILFLTTNRVKTIDPAFNSRISIKLYYDDLDADKREKIWIQLLEKANFNKFNSLDMLKIKQFELNGREIKNIVKLSIAKSKGLFMVLNEKILENEIMN